jgi:hypothetical protein
LGVWHLQRRRFDATSRGASAADRRRAARAPVQPVSSTDRVKQWRRPHLSSRRILLMMARGSTCLPGRGRAKRGPGCAPGRAAHSASARPGARAARPPLPAARGGARSAGAATWSTTSGRPTAPSATHPDVGKAVCELRLQARRHLRQRRAAAVQLGQQVLRRHGQARRRGCAAELHRAAGARSATQRRGGSALGCLVRGVGAIATLLFSGGAGFALGLLLGPFENMGCTRTGYGITGLMMSTGSCHMDWACKAAAAEQQSRALNASGMPGEDLASAMPEGMHQHIRVTRCGARVDDESVEAQGRTLSH